MKAIFVLMDSMNREFLEAYNPDTWVKTPNIARFANDCLRFDKHYTGSLPCMPARRDLMTGRLNFLDRGWGPLEPYDNCLIRILRQNGVFCHIITDHCHYMEMGGENYLQTYNTWDYVRGQEFDPWVSRVKPAPLPEKHYGTIFPEYEQNKVRFTTDDTYPTPICFQNACQWLEDNKDADNYLLQVEVFDPHEPFVSPQEFLDLYGDDYDGPRFDASTYKKVTEPPEAIEHLRKRYAAKLTMVDKWFGKFVDKIQELGLYDDTLIVLTTDHGHLLGDHGYTGKNYMHIYNRIANIPLLVRMPGCARHGQSSAPITQTMDLMPTFIEYFGATVPPAVQGKSMLPVLRGESDAGRDWALYGTFGGSVSVFDGEHTYHRAPKDDTDSPLFHYTSTPTSLLKYLGVGLEERIEMGRFLKHTRYPVYKIPAPMPVMRNISTIEPFRHNELYDWAKDWGQATPIKDRAVEEKMIAVLVRAMQASDAPEEQYERLGLAGRLDK